MIALDFIPFLTRPHENQPILVMVDFQHDDKIFHFLTNICHIHLPLVNH